MLNDDDASQLLSHFPPVEFAFAYGSGVVEQSGYTYEHPAHLPMLDAVLVVDNPTQWHTDNMHQNPSHYSPLIPVGPRLVASFQERIPAHLWFNTYVPITSGRYAGRMMKYGIISKKDILMDLSSWSDLYTAGRLQKPVRILKGNAEIEGAMGLNLESAVRASLLMLPERFDEKDLYMSIASLSYVGDPRMYFGENPKKVVNLVTPVVHHYKTLYQDAIKVLSPTLLASSSGSLTTFTQNTSNSSRWGLCLALPSKVQRLLQIKNREKYMNSKPPQSSAVRAAISSIVARSASMQTIKGFFMVGLVKGSSYLFQKMRKRFA